MATTRQKIIFFSGGKKVDPLPPGAPTIALDASTDTGASSSDLITNSTTPTINFTPATGWALLENDVITAYVNGVAQSPTHTVNATEAANGTGSLGLSPLTPGANAIQFTQTRGVHVGSKSNTLNITVDTTAPTITTASASIAENSALSVTLAADETVTWTKTGGVDQALFTLTGSTLTMAAKNYEAPSDADANNSYIVQVTATDVAGNVTNKTLTYTVTNVNESPVLANALVAQNATAGTAFTPYQFASNTFTDPDAGDTLTYSASGYPSWMTFTAATRTFSQNTNPASGDVGTSTITVTATDSGGLTATGTFTITVAAAGAWTPASLTSLAFWAEAGVQNYQSNAGTTAATANTNPVGFVTDLSGNAFHISSAADDTTRPLLQGVGVHPYLDFDGSNDILLRTAAINLYNSASGYSIYVCVRGNPAVDKTLISEGSSSTTNPYNRAIHAQNGTASYNQQSSRSDTGSNIDASGLALHNAYDNTDKVIGFTDDGASTSTVRQYLSSATEAFNYTYSRGSKTMTCDRFGLGGLQRATPSGWFAGRVYGVVITKNVINATDRAKLITYLGNLAGLSL